jgi:DNA polymerase-3 subunit delta'
MDLNQYTQQTTQAIEKNRFPHGIIVEAENAVDALSYCENCAKMLLKTDDLNNYPDFYIFYPSGKANVIKIEAIRELIDCAQKTPNRGDRKVFIICDAHRLNKNAANALLKTLEEPPLNTTLFLTTPSKNLLLPTITSRCVWHSLPVNVTEILPQEFISWLDQVELFLQKLLVSEAINVLEISAILEALSANLDSFEKNNPEESHTSLKTIYSVLLRRQTEIVWKNFYQKISAHEIEQMMKWMTKASLMLVFNGSFSHVMESILLQFYQMKNNLIVK